MIWFGSNSSQFNLTEIGGTNTCLRDVFSDVLYYIIWYVQFSFPSLIPCNFCCCHVFVAFCLFRFISFHHLLKLRLHVHVIVLPLFVVLIIGTPHNWFCIYVCPVAIPHTLIFNYPPIMSPFIYLNISRIYLFTT